MTNLPMTNGSSQDASIDVPLCHSAALGHNVSENDLEAAAQVDYLMHCPGEAEICRHGPDSNFHANAFYCQWLGHNLE